MALVPGIAFLNAYYVGKFPRQLASLSPLTELVLYFFWALPIDAAALWFGKVTLGRDTFDAAAAVFGLSTSPPHLDKIFEALRSGGGLIWLGYYLTTVMAAVLAGSILRRFVWASRLDIHVPMLRLKSEWYYKILGRTSGVPRSVLPEADVLVEHPEDRSRLYSGVVSGFEVSKDGGIEQLYMQAVSRWKREEKKTVPIPGDLLAIPGSTIKSINMRYIVVGPPEGKLRQFRWLVASFVAAFFEEA